METGKQKFTYALITEFFILPSVKMAEKKLNCCGIEFSNKKELDAHMEEHHKSGHKHM